MEGAAFEIPNSIKQQLESIADQKCCRQYVGSDRSLFLGFGEIVLVKHPRGLAPHGKWEIGTYRSAWRMIHNQQVICGSTDAVESVDEFRRNLARVEGAKCIRILSPTEFDVRMEFDNGIIVDILGTFRDDDEVMHVFLPESIVSFSIGKGWVAECGRGTARA